MDKKLRDFFNVIVVVCVLGVGVSFVIIGLKNVFESDEIARFIEPSRAYETYGFDSIDKWKSSFKKQNYGKIVIGVVLITATIILVVMKKRKNKTGDTRKEVARVVKPSK